MFVFLDSEVRGLKSIVGKPPAMVLKRSSASPVNKLAAPSDGARAWHRPIGESALLDFHDQIPPRTMSNTCVVVLHHHNSRIARDVLHLTSLVVSDIFSFTQLLNEHPISRSRSMQGLPAVRTEQVNARCHHHLFSNANCAFAPRYHPKARNGPAWHAIASICLGRSRDKRRRQRLAMGWLVRRRR
jgi:hypothetical protein